MSKVNQEIEQLLRDSERTVEYSERKPRSLVAVFSILLGVAIVADSSRNIFSFYYCILLLLVGLAILYAGIWMLIICRSEYVYVTTERVLYQKSTWFGKAGRLISIPLDTITSARLCKSSVMYMQRYSGEVILTLHNKKKYALPFLQNGQRVIDAIGCELPRFAEVREDSVEFDMKN